MFLHRFKLLRGLESLDKIKKHGRDIPQDVPQDFVHNAVVGIESPAPNGRDMYKILRKSLPVFPFIFPTKNQ